MHVQQKTVRVIFNKSGGTASKGGVTNRVTIPTTWIREMGITEENRDVTIQFDGEKITIIKA